MPFRLDGLHALVTGGASGIGEQTCRALAGAGALVTIGDLDRAGAERLAQELPGASVAQLDITDESQTQRTIAGMERLDLLINNAGIGLVGGIEETDPTDFDRLWRVNVAGTFLMTKAAMPKLLESRGSIVNIGSKTAVTGQGSTSGYASSKGAIMALTREWAAELLPYGIRVNTVIPAEVMTPLYRSWLDTFPNPEEKLRLILSRIPLEKRMTTSEEIASMTVFLLSEKSSHTTGQHLFVDGGYVHLDRALT